MSTAQRPEIKTFANLEAAFAGESMAHIKYRYFAKLSREMGDEATARAFEETADQEVMHAFGHLDLLYPKASMTPAKALQIAIDGETYSTARCTRASAPRQKPKVMPQPLPRWTNRLKKARCTQPSSKRLWRKPRNALPPWPASRSATPTTTRRNWQP